MRQDSSRPAPAREPAGDTYRPLPARRRLLILVLAIVTALTVMFMLLERPGGVHPLPRAASSPGLPACEPGQTDRCVGGRQPVTVVQPLPGASSPPVGTPSPGR